MMRQILCCFCLLACHVALIWAGRRETVFESIASAGREIADYLSLDRDNNTVKMQVEKISNTNFIQFESNTIPSFTDPNSASIREDNLIVFPYISLSSSESMRLVIDFTQDGTCGDANLPSGAQCLDSITFLVYSTSSATSADDLLSGSIPLLNATLQATGAGGSDEFSQYLTPPQGSAGLRMVIHDKGSAYRIRLVKLEKFACEWNPIHSTDLDMTCQTAYAVQSQNVTVHCTCESNSSPNNNHLYIEQICVLDTQQNSAVLLKDSSLKCMCDSGYELAVDPADSSKRLCKALPSTAPSSTPDSSQPSIDGGSTPSSPSGSSNGGVTPSNPSGSSDGGATPGNQPSTEETTPICKNEEGNACAGSHTLPNCFMAIIVFSAILHQLFVF